MLAKNAFTVRFAILAAIGGTIAMGIFRMPHEVAKNVANENYFLLVWIIGALFTLIAACPISELASAYPSSGGKYPFIHRAFGGGLGFIVGYMEWIYVTAATALIATFATEQLFTAFGFDEKFLQIVAALLILSATVLHLRSTGQTKTVQIVVTVIKLIALLFIVVAIGLWGETNTGTLESNPSAPLLNYFGNFFFASQAVVATFGGWMFAIYFGKEIENPGKTIPQALFGSVISISCIYLLLVLILVWRVPFAVIAENKAPFALASKSAFGDAGISIFTGLVFVIGLSALSACLVGAPRILHSLARDGFFLNVGFQTNSRGVPVIALIATCGVSIIFVATRTFRDMLGLLAFIDAFAYILLIAATFALRIKDPTHPRPYRAWGHPYSTLIALLVACSFVITALIFDTYNSLVSIMIAVSGFLFFWLRPKSPIS